MNMSLTVDKYMDSIENMAVDVVCKHCILGESEKWCSECSTLRNLRDFLIDENVYE